MLGITDLYSLLGLVGSIELVCLLGLEDLIGSIGLVILGILIGLSVSIGSVGLNGSIGLADLTRLNIPFFIYKLLLTF